jgi:Tol biopolymer transport system component
LLILCAACNYPTAATPSAVPTLAATPLPTPTPAPALLPHSLYFLSARSGSPQVWRLERDGATFAQLTDEAEAVLSFDVSPADGGIAYVTGNQIYLLNADGSGRRLLVDNAAADAGEDGFYYSRVVAAPRFSADGMLLAYGYDGVWVYDFATGQALQVLQNEIEFDGDEATPVELYEPISWAPDSGQLLVSVSTPQGSTLAVWDAQANELIRFDSEDLLCCQAAWAPDSRSLLLASATLGIVEPGLWRYDARTGAQVVLIETASGEAYNFAAWPLQLPNGDLQYFYNSTAELPEGDLPLYIVHSATDGTSGRSQVRSEAFTVREALWAEDGSLVLVVQPVTVGGESGPVVLAFMDGRPLQALLDEGYALRWGP